ncbi:MAG TPA: AAA family ATPase [Candidatus Saccharimonadales bacterium]|nr:AAA family ATPase [Candidatus Saccharimonadales bacterium]
MAAYLITGYPATGKSSVADELARRGYDAYNTDDIPGLSHHVHKDGTPVDLSKGHIEDKSELEWVWNKDKLTELLHSADRVFICAITTRQHEFYDQFDKIFVLKIDEATLKRRLLTRTTNDFGKHPNELKMLVDGREGFERQMLKVGAIPIDAMQPLDKVVDDIIAHIL